MKWPKLEWFRRGAPGRIVPAVEIVRRLVHEPFAKEEIVRFIEPIVLVDLQQVRELKGYCDSL